MTDSYSPDRWGWKQDFFSAWITETERINKSGRLVPARVTGQEHHLYEVVCPDFSGITPFPSVPDIPGEYKKVSVSGRFLFGAAVASDYPVPGDWVLVSLVFFIKPVPAPIFALLVLHEHIGHAMLCGIAIIVAGSLASFIPTMAERCKKGADCSALSGGCQNSNQ